MATRKAIVTIAPTGGMASKKQNPSLPTQPEEIARDVIDCWNLGASVVAIHARRPDDQATCNPEIYREINARIRAKSDIIINNSTGGGVNGDVVKQMPNGQWETLWEERIKGIEAGAEMCTLDATTVNLIFDGKEIMFNSPPSKNRELAAAMRARGIKPEWEVFRPTTSCRTAPHSSRKDWTMTRPSSIWCSTCIAAFRAQCRIQRKPSSS